MRRPDEAHVGGLDRARGIRASAQDLAQARDDLALQGEIVGVEGADQQAQHMAVQRLVGLPAAGEPGEVGRGRIAVILEPEARAVLDQLVGERDPAACEHREMVAGAELVLRDQHPPAAALQLLNRHHADPKLEAEAARRQPPGAPQRVRDHAFAPSGGISTVAPSPPKT